MLGQVHRQLRHVLIEVDRQLRLVRLCFEYNDSPMEAPLARCACAATEVIADFPASRNSEEARVAVPMPAPLQSLQYVAYQAAFSAQNGAIGAPRSGPSVAAGSAIQCRSRRFMNPRGRVAPSTAGPSARVAGSVGLSGIGMVSGDLA
ncbi:hypothetical protein [Xanthomonas indica]|uniref:Uncharacterized protein n=1 Tax=Xanthomonas indica TaxID=2912242 RepID=A0AAU8I6W0_9XANT|nr:hypothetical protein [Xanthomonas indica]MCI2260618.1 hypothetical protein [Xanthomonas indica]